MKRLAIFDMDETLFSFPDPTTKPAVEVFDENGMLYETLNNQAFNTYELAPGHSFSFRQFRSMAIFRQSAVPIYQLLELLRNQVRDPECVTVILTARPDMDDKDDFARFMLEYEIDIINDVHVYRSGGTTSGTVVTRKQEILRTLMTERQYWRADMWDDHEGNLKGFLDLQPEVGIILKAHLVTSGGRYSTYHP
jgi:hypothetical protein